MKRLMIVATLAAFFATPASADVTITSSTSGKGMGQTAGGQSVTSIKGNKMRSEITARGQVMVSILDLDAGKLIALNPQKQEAEISDMAELAATLQKTVQAKDVTARVTPNGQTREILGRSCDGYDLTITVPVAMGDQEMALTMSGPVWIAKGAPGAADYAHFYRTAAEKGMFFTSPQQAKGMPAQAKGMAEMYKLIGDTGGLPYAMEVEVRFEGSGMMAGMMNKMGGMSMSHTATAVSTDPVSDDRFTVPAGYKTK